MEDLYKQQCRKKANRIMKDLSHPRHKLFCLLLPISVSTSVRVLMSQPNCILYNVQVAQESESDSL